MAVTVKVFGSHLAYILSTQTLKSTEVASLAQVRVTLAPETTHLLTELEVWPSEVRTLQTDLVPNLTSPKV